MQYSKTHNRISPNIKKHSICSILRCLFFCYFEDFSNKRRGKKRNNKVNLRWRRGDMTKYLEEGW